MLGEGPVLLHDNLFRFDVNLVTGETVGKVFSAGQISYSKVRAMTRWHGEQMDHQLAVLSLLQRE